MNQVKEAHIENDFVDRLVGLKYMYRKDIRSLAALEDNFRQKFEALNRVRLSDTEFARLRADIIKPDVFAAAKHLREKSTFQREDGTPLQYTLVNLKDWCKNDFEVINQLRADTDSSYHQYDVLLLLNGLPVVQIELKTLQVHPRRAMQQIVKYKADPGNGYTNSLLCYLQLFIVSNRSTTYYFANNNEQHFQFDADEQFLPVYQLAREDNTKVNHLDDFAERFLNKCDLAHMISRYMVLVESEQQILVMRPYQIYAVQAIVDCIHDNRGNGYIWHTTGSGKTLTSFKASTLLKDNDDIHKCLFVVDRKDLDRQTREEFNKFQEGSVEENTNTETLVRRMLSTDYADKVIVTTIQKLGLALDSTHRKKYEERLRPLAKKRIVFIFDECHRSQFGDNHQAIVDFFPRAQLFGFTGTPIFEKNATYKIARDQEGSYKTTEDVFQKPLHEYTITHAIEDGNVLRFNIDYFKSDEDVDPKGAAHKRAVVEAVLTKHDVATHYRKFNALLATSSINDAIAYFELFRAVQEEKAAEDENYVPLRIAAVFSPPAEGDKDIRQIQEDLPQERADNDEAPNEKKQALTEIIAHYNAQFGTNHRIGEFDLYYQDVQQRIKDQKYSNADYARENKIDITIVVDMLLTGFDSKYLNTLYVDKNLKYHGLIQAFSRTNRVINDTKPYGNVLDFRQQEAAVEQAMILFSGAKTDNPKEIWLVPPAAEVLDDYAAAVKDLETFFAAKDLKTTPVAVHNLRGDTARAEFITRFKEVQRLRTKLDQYTDLGEAQAVAIEDLIPNEDYRSFKAVYLGTAKRLEVMRDKEPDAPEAVRELDFQYSLFASTLIDYDYIMGLIAKYTSQPAAGRDKMTKEQLVNLLSSSANLLDERDDVIDYIDSLTVGTKLTEREIREGYAAFKTEKSAGALTVIAKTHGIAPERLDAFVRNITDRMIFDGETLSDLLAPLDLGWKARTKVELALMADLVPLLNKLAEGREIAGLNAYE
jgi:type I restriction enzyme R subunit